MTRNPARIPTQRRSPRRFGVPVAGWAAGMLLALAMPVAAESVAAPEPRVDSVRTLAGANGGQDFEQPLGVAIDAQAGEVVVANSGLGRVEFFRIDGRPTGYFVHRITDAKGVERNGMPKHVAVDATGRVYVSDAFAAYVDICDFRGASIGRLVLPAPDDSIHKGSGPGAVAIAPDGRVLVASRGKEGRVHVFDSNGRWLSTWGETGREPGKLSAISGLAVTPNGEIAVACVLTELGVQLFDAEGRYLRGFGVHDMGPGNFSFPSGIVVTPDSRIWVTDMVRQNVQVFDSTGTLLGILGGGGGAEDMSYPSALACDGNGLFAIAETGGKLVRLMWVR